MHETTTRQIDDGGGRLRSRRRRGFAALIAVGALAAVSLTGIASASARTPTPTMVGRAFNVSIATATLGKTSPIVGPIADSGRLTTQSSASLTPPCSVLTGLVSAQALCNQVTASSDPADIRSITSLADAEIGVVGVPAIVLGAVTVSSETTCAGSVGVTNIAYLSVGGHVVINTPTLVKPNTQVSVAGIKLVLNLQVPAPAPSVGLRVDAVHIQIGNSVSSIYVSVGHAESLIKKCPAQD